MGRVRAQKWGPRIIDVDILTYRDMQIREADLIVPHPYISQRAFVLVPMQDVAPHISIAGAKLADLIKAVDAKDVVAMDGPG